MSVEDVNDNFPLTEKPVYYPTVMEGSLAGIKVLQLIAEDADADPNQKITYRITSGNPEGFFAINSSSGEYIPLYCEHFTPYLEIHSKALSPTSSVLCLFPKNISR